MSKEPSVVLVHGAWADGSSWSAVIQGLQANGFRVTAPQFPETSLAADVARLRQVLRRQNMAWTEVIQSDDAQHALKTFIGVDLESRRDWCESENSKNYPAYAGH